MVERQYGSELFVFGLFFGAKHMVCVTKRTSKARIQLFSGLFLPSGGFWPSEDHQVELAVAVVNEIAGVAALVEEGVLFPVVLVGGVVGHQGLDSLDIDTLAGETVGAQLDMEEADEVVEILGNGNRTGGSLGQ